MGSANKSRDDGLILIGMERVHLCDERIDIELFGRSAVQTFLYCRSQSSAFGFTFGILRQLIHRLSSVPTGYR